MRTSGVQRTLGRYEMLQWKVRFALLLATLAGIASVLGWDWYGWTW